MRKSIVKKELLIRGNALRTIFKQPFFSFSPALLPLPSLFIPFSNSLGLLSYPLNPPSLPPLLLLHSFPFLWPSATCLNFFTLCFWNINLFFFFFSFFFHFFPAFPSNKSEAITLLLLCKPGILSSPINLVCTPAFFAHLSRLSGLAFFTFLTSFSPLFSVVFEFWFPSFYRMSFIILFIHFKIQICTNFWKLNHRTIIVFIFLQKI